MSILSAVSDGIANLFKRHKAVEPVKKHDILDLIDNNLISLRVVLTVYDQGPWFADDLKWLKGKTSPSDSISVGRPRELYTSYLRGLSAQSRSLENNNSLSSIYTAAKILIVDHEMIRSKFDSLFKDGTDVSDITLEQMKLSHATIFGFINLSSILADWFCFFLGELPSTSYLGDHPELVLRVPEYRFKFLEDSVGTVSDFVNDVINRGSTRGFLSVIQSVKSAGDVAIYTNAAALDTYANIADYPQAMRFMAPFTSFQPILMVRESLGSFARIKYKRNLLMRDWVQAKIVILQMDSDKMDPSTPEYQRQRQILQRYSDELAKLDRKIADYEMI